MGRDNTVALSDEEKEELDTVRDDIFGTDEVSYGLTISRLVEEYFDDS